jgi:hypothetical protein
MEAYTLKPRINSLARRRIVIVLAVMIVTGCASRPGVSHDPAQAPVLAITSQNPSYIEAQRIAAARNLNLRVVTSDGVRLFCKSNLVSGSHIVRDATCYTAEQVDQMDQNTQRDLQFFLIPNLPIGHP